MNEWIHVVHTYRQGRFAHLCERRARRRLDEAGRSAGDQELRRGCGIGGWYNNYDFVGDIDEVRISKVARSADWVKLQYENQKPLQTLVGPVVQPGNAFSVSPAQATVLEGKSATLYRRRPAGRRRSIGSSKRDGRETVVAVDRFPFHVRCGPRDAATRRRRCNSRRSTRTR